MPKVEWTVRAREEDADYMHACMCMYVCTYVRMYVCIYTG
jgi:hypothetical protein